MLLRALAVAAAGCSVASTNSLQRSVLRAGGGTVAAVVQKSGSSGATQSDERRHGDHFLTNTELGPISSVACLEAKQKNPRVVCDDADSVPTLPGAGEFGGAKNASQLWSGELSAGNFPNYQDPACNSNGEYLCDPNEVMTAEERASVAAELKKMREENLVTCGHLLDDKVDPRHLQPFYLGVVVIKEWPISQSDPESLQQLGQIISAQWNMNEAYVGNLRPYVRCPNAGVLLILPNSRQTYLSAESCEFICQARGGPEAITASQLGLRKSVADAALAGVDSVYRFLGRVPEKSSVTVVNAQAAAGERREQRADDALVLFLRALFFVAILMLVGSLGVAAAIAYFAPGIVAKRRT